MQQKPAINPPSPEATTPVPIENVFRINPAFFQEKTRDLPLSKRAMSALARMGTQKLGDLDGIACSKLLELKNCGAKTFNEIVRLIEKYAQSESQKDGQINRTVYASGNNRTLSIPEYARNWPVSHLPLSIRLDHVLQKLNHKTLGDLHGVVCADLLVVPNCGQRTLNELQDIISRIERGEFGSPEKPLTENPIVSLVGKIDATVAQLQPQYRQIFIDRTGGMGQPMALAEVGRKFNMTRERVRQIVDMLLVRITRAGGPEFAQALKQLGEELNRLVLPLTPQFIKSNLDKASFTAAHSLPFYIRLMDWISKDFSAWPTGQTPAALRTPELEKVLTLLKKRFEGKTMPMTFAEAYQEIKTEDASCTPFTFMEALRYAAEFEISLDDPFKPTIAPPEESPRRWAQTVLMRAKESSITSASLARARAILQVRRSPRSEYHLVSTT
ncbi:MAG: DNA-directed RNA polymerase subunit alpha C-terminal domain-containing protein [Verrucomicrobiae bacterium]|nr:DNA-directed RNA polymerase subunit alpha C-terminal domain-containing protein [Verrucomicrobiae bacterium]